LGIPIQDGGLLSGRLQRLLQLQGRVPLEVEGFVLPTIQVGDLSDSGIPAVRRHVSTFVQQNAVVAENAIMRLDVPPGVLCEIRNFSVFPDANVGMRIGWGSTLAAVDLPSVSGSTIFTDLRLGVLSQNPQVPAGVMTHGTSVAGLATFQKRLTASGTIGSELFFEPKGWIIGSGRPVAFGFLEFGFDVVNTRVRMNIEWDEYQLF